METHGYIPEPGSHLEFEASLGYVLSFKASLNYTVRHFLKKMKTKTSKNKTYDTAEFIQEYEICSILEQIFLLGKVVHA